MLDDGTLMETYVSFRAYRTLNSQKWYNLSPNFFLPITSKTTFNNDQQGKKVLGKTGWMGWLEWMG